MARDVPVDIELVLAVDISGSVDIVEAQLQRNGYVEAIKSEEVIKAIKSGILGRIAVTYVEWSDAEYQNVIVPWTLIASAEDADGFSKKIAAATFDRGLYTSISGLIRYVMPMYDNNGFEGTRRVIDISGDGPNNVGGLVTEAREEAIRAGFTINGLPIVNDRVDRYGPPMPNLDLYYANCVIGGPRAFMIAAQGFDSFAIAIRKKLLLEISGIDPTPEQGLLIPAAAPKAPPCNEGERRLRRRQGGFF